jgi:hypothetical protein
MSLTILVPIFGYLILFNDQLIKLFEISEHLLSDAIVRAEEGGVTEVSPEAKARLYNFYFGLTFLGIASFIYQMFCSKLIKEYNSDREYVKEEIPFITDLQIERISKEIKKSDNIAAKELDSLLARYEIGWQISAEDEGGKINAAITDLLRLHWKSENNTNIVARLSVFIFYILGFIALAYPSILMFKKVVVAYLSS